MMRVITPFRLGPFGAVCIIVLLAAISGLGEDKSVLSDIHKRLGTPGIEQRHDHDRMLFVAEIVGFGPVFQGVCKEAVDEKVDFRVTTVLLGNPPQPVVHAGYANCTRGPLPSPPFTLRGSVVVYCFYNMRALRCLAPVRATEQRIETVKSWIAHVNDGTHGGH